MPAPKGNKFAEGNNGGRPSDYSIELCQEICDKVADGESIKHVLKSDDKYPTFQTWCNWKRANKELFDLYINALQDKAEFYIDEMHEVYNKLKKGEISASDANVLLQQNKWITSKFYPKMFGNKTDITSNGETINLPSALDLSKLSDSALKELEEASVKEQPK